MTENGAGPDLAAHLEHSRATRERIAAEVRELLASEERLHDELAAQLTEVRQRRDGYRRALAQFDDERPKHHSRTPKPGRWQVSEEKIAEIWELLRHRTDTFTANRVAQETPGLSTEAMRRAANVLRERELLRLAGKARGGGNLLAVMPGAGEREASGAA